MADKGTDEGPIFEDTHIDIDRRLEKMRKEIGSNPPPSDERLEQIMDEDKNLSDISTKLSNLRRVGEGKPPLGHAVIEKKQRQVDIAREYRKDG